MQSMFKEGNAAALNRTRPRSQHGNVCGKANGLVMGNGGGGWGWSGVGGLICNVHSVVTYICSPSASCAFISL